MSENINAKLIIITPLSYKRAEMMINSKFKTANELKTATDADISFYWSEFKEKNKEWFEQNKENLKSQMKVLFGE